MRAHHVTDNVVAGREVVVEQFTESIDSQMFQMWLERNQMYYDMDFVINFEDLEVD